MEETIQEERRSSCSELSSLHSGHRQRLKQQFMEHSSEVLNDHQLLELLLFYSIPRKDTNPIAHRLLRQFGSLEGVLRAAPEVLEKMPNISANTTALFRLVTALHRRIEDAQCEAVALLEPEDIAEYLFPYFSGFQEERLFLLCCNQRNQVVSCDLLSVGNSDRVLLNLRTVVTNALNHDASWVVLAHSHPSGFAIPSDADITATRRCRDALQNVEIQLRDHLIFADDDYVSMKQSRFL